MIHLFLISLVTFCAGQSIVVSDCSEGTSLFKIQSVNFSPSVPVAGDEGTLHTVYTVPYDISAGAVTYKCILNGLSIYNEKYDICTQTKCPITAGTHDDYSISEIPSVSGKLKCTILWQDMDGNELLCIDTTMKLLSEVGNLRGSTPDVSNFRPRLIYGTNLDGKIGHDPVYYGPYWPDLVELNSSSSKSNRSNFEDFSDSSDPLTDFV
jgi:hypothetical protein